ncbi:hypothetical protein EOM09_05860 [bacterium]|nr:hypothetical protein [bacterium]
MSHNKSLLTSKQQEFLTFFNHYPDLYQNFYFSGGTALAEFYLQHRFSEDLDFFSLIEINPHEINLFLNSHKIEFSSPQIQFRQSFNRNLFFLTYTDNSKLKLEFTYYPFPQLEIPQQQDNLKIDSVFDIAVNKIFTLSQQARGRDYFDLYIIEQKYSFSFEKLIKKAREKFDYPIDYLQLGINFNQVDHYLDDPILLKKINHEEISVFFKKEAQKLKNKIVK